MKIQIIIFTMISIILSGCQINKNPCSLSEEVIKDLNRLDSLIKTPETLTRSRQIMKDNYDEPSLLDAKYETYRFILSSSDYSKVVRIENRDKYFRAVIKEFEGTTGDPNLVPNVDEFELTQQKWDSITDKLKEMNFWIFPSSIDRNGLDGSYWSLEAYKPTKDDCTMRHFHIVSRWSPVDTAFINMCRLLSELKK